jgi:DNA replication protein DnaC
MPSNGCLFAFSSRVIPKASKIKALINYGIISLSLGQQGSHLFFQVISGRHQLKSTVITTNLPFADWGKVFDSTTVATAIADRLVHNSEVLILAGTSYRRKLT